MKNNQIKLGDLGEAKNIENSLADTIGGTPIYMSPEMQKKYLETHFSSTKASNVKIDISTDIW